MFTNISLCPGGAMMFHESVAEFDPNVASASVQSTPADEEVTNAIKTELSKVEADRGAENQYCPIGAVVEKLRPCYNLVQELARTPLNPDTNEEAINTLEKISSGVSTIAETIRMCLVKQNAVMNYTITNPEWALEPLSEHLGWFIKNYNRILGQGYGVYTRNILTFAPLDSYAVNRALSLFTAAVENLTVVPFDISRLYDITNYDRSARIFSSTEDMMKCLFEDRDRFDRLAKMVQESTDMESLIYRCTSRDYGPVDACGNRDAVASLVNYISHILRLVKCGCYDLQCEFSDPEASLQGIIPRIRPLMVGTINIFYIGAIKLFSNAIVLKNVMEHREELKRFIEVTKEAVK